MGQRDSYTGHTTIVEVQAVMPRGEVVGWWAEWGEDNKDLSYITQAIGGVNYLPLTHERVRSEPQGKNWLSGEILGLRLLRKTARAIPEPPCGQWNAALNISLS
jgi:hypothetical protein